MTEGIQNSAELCRLMGWEPGDVLQADGGRDCVAITAIGETRVLGRRVSLAFRQQGWPIAGEMDLSLCGREWQLVDEVGERAS
jgi:hypothetical protein